VAAALTAPPADVPDGSTMRIRQFGSEEFEFHLLPRLAGHCETSWVPIGDYSPDMFLDPYPILGDAP